MNLAPPSSQKASERPISFLLSGGGASASVDLVIRPEDLSRTDVSRLSVQQTLGESAWADNFGPGLPSITISGHTGWRRTESSNDDGLARFTALHSTVFSQWHSRRKQMASTGQDPDNVRLIFVDTLDGIAEVVAPLNFALRRSKSRPLLAQYQLAMTVLNQPIDGPPISLGLAAGYLGRSGDLGAGVLEGLGIESLTASIDRITGYIDQIRAGIDSTLLAPVRSFMYQTARLYGSVRGLISAGSSIAGSVIRIAQTVTQAGVNVFRTLAAVASIPQLAKQQLMSIAGAYSNILCVLRNALRQQRYYQDYSDVYGSSNCSSTAGGRPISSLAGENPFYRMVPTSQPLPVTMTPSAQSSVLAMASSDPVLAPMSTASLGANLTNVQGGMVVA